MKELKNILVTTDFSKGSYNALEYAVEIAKVCDVHLFLLHAYRLIPSAPKREDAHAFKKKLEETIENEFIKICDYVIDNKGVKHPINCVSQIGFPEDVIESFANNESVDLIVMGTSGQSNSSKIFGSTLSAVAQCTHQSILAVPENVSFKKWKRILMTEKNTSSSKTIPYLIKKFNSKYTNTNLDNEKSKNIIPENTILNSHDLLSLQYKEYILLEKEINQSSNSKSNDELIIPLLIA